MAEESADVTAAGEIDWLGKRTKYETLLDGGMTVSIPATLLAATALDLVANKELRVKDTNVTGIVYVLLLSFIGITSLFNVALSMMLHFHAKVIFSSPKLPGPMLQCREFEDLWREFARARRYSREGFNYCVPGFLLAMAWRPGLWKKPGIFSYISCGVFAISAFVVFYWLYRITHFRRNRNKAQRTKDFTKAQLSTAASRYASEASRASAEADPATDIAGPAKGSDA